MEAKIQLKAGDYVAVDSWVNSTDKSYSTDVLLVECIDGNLIHCSDIRSRSRFPIILRAERVNLLFVSKEFAESIINRLQEL